MGVDSQIVGNCAKGHCVEHDGLVYYFKLIDQTAKAEWERRLYARAKDVARITAADKGGDWLEGRLVELEEAFFAGEFSFLSERSLKLAQKPAGVELLLSILTGKDLNELIPLLTERSSEVKAMLHLILRESFPGLKIAERKTDDGDERPANPTA